MPTDETHDPSLKSWVESANDPATDFPIQNLPWCAVYHPDDDRAAEEEGAESGPRFCIAIGDKLLDLNFLEQAGTAALAKAQEDLTLVLDSFESRVFDDKFAIAHAKVRRWLVDFLRADSSSPASGGQRSRRLREKCLIDPKDVELTVAVPPANYTDFYASIHHASTVGSMFRPENPLLPNYKWVPIGYHGRSTSILVSGADITRPKGQLMADGAPAPAFGPCKMLDYELEVGCVIGESNALGEPVSIARARNHILGLCLVNDWSARDVQKWEYQPLGPFLAKNFATTISPFLVTLDALEPFRCPAAPRAEGDPRPLDYLIDDADQAAGGFDITLEVYLQSADMKKRGLPPHRISHGRAFKDMYWTFAQMVAHHTSNGCNLLGGDLLASGTVSGPDPTSRGCLLELTWDGHGPDGKPKPRKPIQLPTGETRTFLADGDTVTLKAYCERDGFRRIGFGECSGTILPARA